MVTKKHKGRPKQPTCPHCKRPLFKRMDAGQVQKSDPYSWCRNKSCAWYNKSQTDDSSFTPLPGDGSGCKRLKKKKLRKKVKATKKAIAAKPKQTEAEPVTKARERIKRVLEAAEKQYGANAIGLALAIVSQETGNQKAANLLIEEYNLIELYGILPQKREKS